MENKELIPAIEYFKVDKISDDVYALGPNVILKFNVSLSKISNGKRYHFHKEYEYHSKGISEPLVTMKRSFDYYLSIENAQKDNNGNKVFIRIGPQEYLLFKKALEECVSWFIDAKYAKLFARDKGKLVLVSPVPETKMRNLPMGKYMEFTPVIIDKGVANADKEPGIRITLGDYEISYIDINIDRLMGLYYIISSFNMYQSAQLMINYLGRPEFGANRFVMDSPRAVAPEEDARPRRASSGIDGRFVTPVGTKNNMESLE